MVSKRNIKKERKKEKYLIIVIWYFIKQSSTQKSVNTNFTKITQFTLGQTVKNVSDITALTSKENSTLSTLTFIFVFVKSFIYFNLHKEYFFKCRLNIVLEHSSIM